MKDQTSFSFDSSTPDRSGPHPGRLIPLLIEHRKIVRAIEKHTKSIMARSDLAARQYHDLSVLLLGLQLLPHPVEGLDVTLTIGPARNGESMYSEMRVAASEFELAEGGVIDRGDGPDAYRSCSLRATEGQRRPRGSTSSAWIWLERFGTFSVAEDSVIELRNVGGCDIAWDKKPDAGAWELLETDFPD